MSKPIIILISVFGILTLTVVLLSGFAKKQPMINDVPKTGTQGSPSPFFTTGLPQLEVVSSNPPNNSSDQSLNTYISIRFNRQITESDIQIKINPEIEYSLNIPDETVFIRPKTPLQVNSAYTISATFSGSKIYTWKFSTGTSSAIDTAPDIEFFLEREANLREQRPDLYLYNNTPFENSDFKIIAVTLKSSPKSHYSFEVTLKNQNSAGFINWLKSLEFTDTQIQELDIEYQ